MRSREIEEYKKRLNLTADQREALIGMLLGDATLETINRGWTYRLKVEHSLRQKTYVEHLYKLFEKWVLTKPRLINKVLSNRKTYRNIGFSTVSHAAFRFYAHQFYRANRKIVPKLIRKWLTPKVLTYWYMDDGSVKSKQSKGVIINTHCFSLSDITRLICCLNSKFDLLAKMRKQKEGYQIYISGKSYETFKHLISPYLIPEMRYKLPEARRTHLPKE